MLTEIQIADQWCVRLLCSVSGSSEERLHLSDVVRVVGIGRPVWLAGRGHMIVGVGQLLAVPKPSSSWGSAQVGSVACRSKPFVTRPVVESEW